MKKLLSVVLLLVILLSTDVFAQKKRSARRKPRLSFEAGDLMIYFVTGYPKLLDMNLYGLGTEKTALPPLGGGLQISFLDFMSVGGEALYTHRNTKIRTRGVSVDVKETYITALGKVQFHYPLGFFDPYVGGGVGWTFVRHDVNIVEDYGQLYWVATAGFRLAFGNGSPIGIFVEGSFPYPLIAGGLYVRFSLW